ncbi:MULTISPECIES: hypothetical protein [unclassified Roseivirga]|uniref:hypothetical protein n=1 Tax=unclassified Roseivirga TaxID=2626142 RepID=UPI00257E1CFF|nr:MULTISPECIES: hypothetical protein [unclassified Roseivirga]|tara:strand:+ start:155 stop:574 length:420 start_codon:yes stop_codon:yes gene_type:complete
MKNNINSTVMNSSKVNTQNNSRRTIKNISSLIAMALAMVTLFQASADKPGKADLRMSALESSTLLEIEASFNEAEEMSLEEIVLEELALESTEGVKVFDSNGELLASGNPTTDSSLRGLVNKADYLASFGSKKYYRLAE